MSDTLRATGFSLVPHWIMDVGLSDKAVLTYLVLRRKADTTSASEDATGAFPSYRTIAAAVGCSRSTAIRAVQELIDIGALVKEERRRPDGSQTSNVYTLLADPPRHRGVARVTPPPSGTSDTPPVAGVTPLDQEPSYQEPGYDLEHVAADADDERKDQPPPPSEEELLATPTSDAARERWEDARALCEFLADMIVRTRPPGSSKRPPSVTQAWVRDMELLMRIDVHTREDVEAAIRWAHEGPGSVGNGNGWSGWGAQVQSPAALRRHWDKMVRQARAAKPKGEQQADNLRAMSDRLRDVDPKDQYRVAMGLVGGGRL